MTTRRLAAVLAADVVGFSSMMEKDEEGTLERIKKLQREVIEPRVKERGGRLVKTTGDGFLCEFGSPVEAVRCALEVQEATRANGDVEHSLLLRMGINLGDIIVEPDGDIYGDGVNVAARLEHLAEPGGIYVSDDVHRHVVGKIDRQFQDRGEQQVKNIARPVRVFALTGTSPATKAGGTRNLPLPDKPSIAVLPFANMSGDPEQEYFADGIVEDIITALSRVKSFFVIARNSSFTYKGRAVDVRQVGRELGVRYVLEGSIRKASNRVRMAGQLIEAETAHHVWADRFDGTLDDIFELQDRITESVAAAIEPTVRVAEIARASSKPTESLEAYDLYLRALPEHYSMTREGLRRALELFSEAIRLDPSYSLAKAFAAYTHGFIINQGFGDEGDWQQGLKLAREAIAANRDDPVTLKCAGHMLAYIGRDYDMALAALDRAITLNPNSAHVYNSSGWVRAYMGDYATARDHFQRAIRLSPLDPEMGYFLAGLAIAHIGAGQDSSAVEPAQRAVREMPAFGSGHRALMIALVGTGRVEEATAVAKAYLATNPSFRLSEFHRNIPHRDEALRHRILEALRVAGLPE